MTNHPMLHVALRIAAIYLVAGLALLVGVGVGSDVRRWLQRTQQTRQRVAQRLGRAWH